MVEYLYQGDFKHKWAITDSKAIVVFEVPLWTLHNPPPSRSLELRQKL